MQLSLFGVRQRLLDDVGNTVLPHNTRDGQEDRVLDAVDTLITKKYNVVNQIRGKYVFKTNLYEGGDGIDVASILQNGFGEGANAQANGPRSVTLQSDDFVCASNDK